MDYLTLEEVSAKLKLSPITLRRYIKNGLLIAKKVGRSYSVAPQDLETFIENTADEPNKAKIMVSKALNNTLDFEYGHQRADLMAKARDIFHKNKMEEEAKKANYDSNIFNYTLTNIYKNNASRQKWGRFGPVGIFTGGNGEEIYRPDPAWIDAEMLAHIKLRLKQTKNPLVTSIYYDMLFTKSRESDKHKYAQEAITCYLEAFEVQFSNGWGFQYVDSLTRALELSAIVKDDRTKSIIKKMLKHSEEIIEDGEPRMTLELFEVLIKNRQLLTNGQLEKIISLSDKAARFYGLPNICNQHLQRSFIEVVKSIHRLQKDNEKESADILAEAESYIEEANSKKGSGLPEAHFLEKAIEVLRSIKDPQNRQAELKKRIEQSYLDAESQMKTISVPIEIPDKERQDFINRTLTEDPLESLERIGSLPYLIPNYKHAEKIAGDLFKKYPMSNIFSTIFIEQGRKVTSTSGGLQVTEDHIITSLSRDVFVYTIFLAFLFDELKTRGVTAGIISDFIKSKAVYKLGRFDAIAEGLELYQEEKYFAAVQVLAPQVEEVLRLFLRTAGYPTLKVTPDGNQQVIKIAEILEAPAFKNMVPDDIYWYFRLILYDKRGPAIRDKVAHGLYHKSGQNKLDCVQLLHLLLMLTNIDIKEKQPEETTPQTSKDDAST